MKIRVGLISLALAAALAGCGGGGSGQPADNQSQNTSLRGTAAGGSALVGTVTVKDSAGVTKTAPIQSGFYTIDVSGMKAPFALKAEGTFDGVPVVYYSAATQDDLKTGRINVTPLTTVIVTNLAGGSAQSFYDNGNFSTVTAASLNKAEQNLRAKLKPVLDSMNVRDVDLLRVQFDANHTGLDLVLDEVKVDIDSNTNVATFKSQITGTTFGSITPTASLDNPTSFVIDDTNLAYLNSAITDRVALNDLLVKTVALFKDGQPTMQQMADSGIFDSTNFVFNGGNYQEWAQMVTSQSGYAKLAILTGYYGYKLDPNNPNLAEIPDVTIETPAFRRRHMSLWAQRANANSPWRLIGNQMLADIEVNPVAVRSSLLQGAIVPSATFSSGLRVNIQTALYNNKQSLADQKITSAIVTGPGLPVNGVAMTAGSYGYLVVSNTKSNIIPECTSQTGPACINMSQIADTSAYTVKLFKQSQVAPLNGAGSTVTIGKKPLATADLNADMFTASIGFTDPDWQQAQANQPVTSPTYVSSAQFFPNKRAAVCWGGPVTTRGDNNFVSLEGDNYEIKVGLQRTASCNTFTIPSSSAEVKGSVSFMDLSGREFVSASVYR